MSGTLPNRDPDFGCPYFDFHLVESKIGSISNNSNNIINNNNRSVIIIFIMTLEFTSAVCYECDYDFDYDSV